MSLEDMGRKSSGEGNSENAKSGRARSKGKLVMGRFAKYSNRRNLPFDAAQIQHPERLDLLTCRQRLALSDAKQNRTAKRYCMHIGECRYSM